MDSLLTKLGDFLSNHLRIVLVTGILGSGLGIFTTYNKIFKEEVDLKYTPLDSNSQISLVNLYEPPSPFDLRVLWKIKQSFFGFFSFTIFCTIIVLYILLSLFWLLEQCFEYVKIIVLFLVSYAIASKTLQIQQINEWMGGFDLDSVSLTRNFVVKVLDIYEQAFSSNSKQLRKECGEFLRLKINNEVRVNQEKCERIPRICWKSPRSRSVIRSRT
jgi:hypothetical protein